jgi:hypothetical protein
MYLSPFEAVVRVTLVQTLLGRGSDFSPTRVYAKAAVGSILLQVCLGVWTDWSEIPLQFPSLTTWPVFVVVIAHEVRVQRMISKNRLASESADC